MVLKKVTQYLGNLFGKNHANQDGSHLFTAWKKRGAIKHDAQTMISGVIKVFHLQARNVMVPKAQMVSINIDDDNDKIHEIISESKYSRYPVLGNNTDEISGILLAKDILDIFLNKQQPYELKDLIRKAIIIPESQRLDSLLKMFRNTHNHMAIVIDEFGSISGIVSIEDVLEQIVGEIEDEDYIEPENKLFIINNEENMIEVNALAPIDEFNKYFDTKIPTDEFDTIGGVVAKNLGHLPKKPGAAIFLYDLNIIILEVSKRRIKTMGIKRADANN
jgi:magnesium and cobalt transporter